MDVSIYHLRSRDVLTLCVLSLLLMGVLMVQSASMHVHQDAGGTTMDLHKWGWTDPGLKQIFFAAVAMITFLIVGKIDYMGLMRGTNTTWRNPILWCFAIASFMCLAVLIPHVGIEKNGARRWLSLGICQVQPSELAKWAVVLFLAWWLTARPVDLNKFSRFLLTLVPIAAICLLVVIQDFGTAALIGVCAIAMLLIGRVKWWHLLLVIPPALGAAVWFVAHKEYRLRRMTAFMDPYANPKEGYHIIQSLLSFATGGLTGKGLGNGIQKLGYLPEDTTDFIFSVICEELGLFGALLTAALYLGIIYVAWQTIKQKRDSFGRMLAFGVATMVCLQAAINMAVATVSVPTKGLSLPLISAGGSGLVITCAALGLLYSVCRYEHEEESATIQPTMKKPRPPHKRTLPNVVTENVWQEWTVQS
ncbi:MAG TPA: putative peptidoglycan glycosyltransferase FtsW [Tepidisphaeraceae bacterium]|jgi:cell division protein FtsW|nr:putative peptidoglycan glycosyltransferase FtsW [Tepidisphaeraceae bacterium]